MKKSVLSILAIAFAAVSVLSSCNKNDDGYGQSAKTKVQTTTTPDNSANYYSCVYLVGDDIAPLGTFTVTVSDGTKSSDFDAVAQGKHGTFTVSGKQVTGYLFTYTQPAKNSVKASIKYTPNDKVKSLTANDEINPTLISAKFYSATATPAYDQQLTGADRIRATQGNCIVEVIQSIVSALNN